MLSDPKDVLQSCEEHESQPEAVTESMQPLSRAVFERYCCPNNFLDFELIRDLCSDDGYFRFGPNITCYGRSCSGTRRLKVELALDDTVEHVVVRDGKVKLPFDPTEITDNLRFERYARGSGGFRRILRRLYYLVRPLTTPSLRKRVQRFNSRNWVRQVFPHWPVDTTVESLCEKLMLLALEAKGAERIPFVWFWPRGFSGCLTMTHDVETEAGRDFCEEIMEIDDHFGIKASFQIVPEKRYAVPSKLIEFIYARGFEIAIQDLNHDGGLFESREKFLRRVKRINQYGRQYGARGFRAGSLYRHPEWYDALNFSFDMSIPNVAHLDPQRGGCCTVMPYFIGDILELPVTTTQDYMLFHLLNEGSIDLWKTQTQLILEKNGLASFIVHPDYVIDPEPKRMFKELLSYLRDLRMRQNLWFALPSEIDCWWRARSKMSVLPNGDSFRIEGEGAERATLAFAANVNGRLVFEIGKDHVSIAQPSMPIGAS
jgi:hypothetical protein